MPPPPFRTNQVGSLIRPQYLLEARAALAKTRGDQSGASTTALQDSSLRETSRKAIAEVLQQQQERRITPLSSGEFERQFFFDGFFESIKGMETRWLDWSHFLNNLPANGPFIEWGMKGRDAVIATQKIEWTNSGYLDDWMYVRSLLPQGKWKDVKVTLPSPAWWHDMLRDGKAYDEDVYSSGEEYLHDVATALNQEIRTLHDAGLRFVQIDDPNILNFCDEAFLEQSAKDGVDTDALLNLYIDAHNTVLRDLPSDMTVGIHMCRGNFPNAVFVTTGNYENVAKKLFQETDFKLFYMEFDTDRAGDFTPLKHLPADKAVVLGVVTTKYAELEDINDLMSRVREAADVIARAQGKTQRQALDDNLAVSPQCGFASVNEGKGIGMTVERQWENLELLKQLANELWPS